jgi:transposase
MNGERFERHRALVEDIAYSGMSAQEIAEKYGLTWRESNSSLRNGQFTRSMYRQLDEASVEASPSYRWTSQICQWHPAGTPLRNVR